MMRSVDLRPTQGDRAKWFVTRGTKRPRGVAWFGFRSFWGPLYHLVASVIATEDIDSRDWMKPDEPSALAVRVAGVLLGVEPERLATGSLTDLLDRDVWIDFIADTGDDVSVSEAVGRLLASTYTLPDVDPGGRPGTVLAGRADILLHGGDLAYPVATDTEIHDRFVAPFNRALVQADDGRPRVLMGVPGNHDWYNGLDGFNRLMRYRTDPSPAANHGERRRGHLRHGLHWAAQFLRVRQIQKRRTLVLHGYVPVQEASYFALPIAPQLDLWGLDRQLRSIDYRQRRYFERWRGSDAGRRRIVLFPDPVYAHLEPSVTGVAMAHAVRLDLRRIPHLCIAGDLHHYERLREGASLHVTAGGGGAFLHGARLNRRGRKAPDREWPGQRTTLGLIWRVPFAVVLGSAGFIPHVVLLFLFAPLLVVGAWALEVPLGTRVATALAAVVLAMASTFASGHQVNRKRFTIPLAVAFGLWIAWAPIAASELVLRVGTFAGVHVSGWAHVGLVLAVSIPLATFGLGALLGTLSALGLESTLAISALSYPGFKHFVRMRVRRDGRRVDAWVIGLEDPLAVDASPVLVDRWSWDPWEI